MKEQLEAIRAAAKKALSDCADSKVLETLRVQYLGKKGELTGILKQMGKLSAEERPSYIEIWIMYNVFHKNFRKPLDYLS